MLGTSKIDSFVVVVANVFTDRFIDEYVTLIAKKFSVGISSILVMAVGVTYVSGRWMTFGKSCPASDEWYKLSDV